MSTDCLQELETALGRDAIVRDKNRAQYDSDWRGRLHGRSLAVVCPARIEEVCETVRIAGRHGVAVVPQGGNTGLSGGATPDSSGTQLVLCTRRLNRIRSVDLLGNFMTVDAGCILQNVQDAALRHDRFFPLSLAAQGSCTIGGNLATNAGGNAVLRYGNVRELCVGIEAVDAYGRLVGELKCVRKNNAGYSLRDLLIGSEGTLAIITGAVLRVFPRPFAHATALVKCDDIARALQLLGVLRTRCADFLSGAEWMSNGSLANVLAQFPDTKMPTGFHEASLCLVELSGSTSASVLDDMLAGALAHAIESGVAADAALASNLTERNAFWTLRERLPLAEARCRSLKHDISLPAAHLNEFVTHLEAWLSSLTTPCRWAGFGHLGDGNLHANVLIPDVTPDTICERIDEFVYSEVMRLDGSVSAEHGIGSQKNDLLHRALDAASLKAMQAVKQALDPHGLFNPGKLLFN
jgi:FAD/FMN-containing dehydrogenase